jgi:hypothetical protein
MSDDISDIDEIIRQWHDICSRYKHDDPVLVKKAKEFHTKHGRAMVVENTRRGEVRLQEERSRPCPRCKAKVGKPCKDVYIREKMSWHHEERSNKETA